MNDIEDGSGSDSDSSGITQLMMKAGTNEIEPIEEENESQY